MDRSGSDNQMEAMATTEGACWCMYVVMDVVLRGKMKHCLCLVLVWSLACCCWRKKRFEMRSANVM